jgi:hypothetical protein
MVICMISIVRITEMHKYTENRKYNNKSYEQCALFIYTLKNYSNFIRLRKQSGAMDMY